jgi:hypothetical protein
MLSRSFRRFFASRKTAPIHARTRLRVRPTVEQLEVREVPALSTVNQFTPGNLVVLQAGDGVNNLTAAPLYLDEFNTTAGSGMIQQAVIPNTQTASAPGAGTAGNQPITIDVTAAAGNGQLIRSFDGSSLTFTGLDANTGSTATNSGVDRVVAQVPYTLQSTGLSNLQYTDPTVTLTTNTAQSLAVGQQITVSGVQNSNFNGTFAVASVSGTTVTYTKAGAGSPGSFSSATVVSFNVNTGLHGQMSQTDDLRGAAEVNTGTGSSATLYTFGHNPNGGTLFFNKLAGVSGATAGTLVSQNTNVRAGAIGFDGRLYWTSASGAPSGPAGVYTESSAALPTSKSPTDTLVAGATGDTSGKLGGVYLADVNGDGLVDEGDRLYFVDDGTVNHGTTGGLYVSVFHSGAWGASVNITPYGSAPTNFNFGPGTDQLRGLAGVVVSANEVKLYATTMDGTNGDNSNVYLFDDNFQTNDATNEGTNLLPYIAPGTSQTITNATESGSNVVTITTSSALGVIQGQQVVVNVPGDAKYNGIWTVTSASGSQFTYNDTNSGASNQTSGTASTNSGSVVLQSVVVTDLTGYRGVSLAPVAPTSATLTVNTTTPAPGANVVFTVSLTSASGIPTGSIVLRDGNSVLNASLTTILNGVATYTLVGGFANGGIHNISAYYPGGAFAAATSNTVTVTQDGTTNNTNSLTANINPTTVGQTITLTDTISGGDGTHNITGNVVFMDGATVLGNANLSGNSTSATTTLNVSFATTGSHSLTAVYGGNLTYKSTTSGTLSETVNSNASATVTSSQVLGVVSATPTYTATITGFSGSNVDGTVQFFLDGTSLGTQTLGPTGKATETASIASTALTAGSHFITVKYTPTASNTPFQTFTTTNATALIQYAQQAFGAGDLVVVRRGDGGASLGSANTLVFLNDYDSTGTLIQSIAMPNADLNGSHILGMSGTAGTEGQVNLSVDGRYLTLGGFDTTIGTASVTGTTPATVKRTVARVDGLGNIDTSTILASADGVVPGNIRAVDSTDGSQLWVGSDVPSGTTDSGINYSAIGNTGAPTMVGPANATERDNAIYYSQLYATTNDKTNQTQIVSINATGGTFTLTYGGQTTSPALNWNATALQVQSALQALSSIPANSVTVVANNVATGYVVNFVGSLNTTASALTGDFSGLTGGVGSNVAQGVMGIETVGSGTPTTAAALTQLPGFSAAYNANLKVDPFAFLLTSDVQGAGSPNVCYIADQTNGLVKFGLDSGTGLWTFQGNKLYSNVGAATGLTGVANFSGSTFTNVTLYVSVLSTGIGNPGDTLASYIDNQAHTAPLNGTLNLLKSAPANESFTGIAFAPSVSTNGSLTSGDLVVTRVGESSNTPRASTGGTSGVFLDQYTTAANQTSPVSTISLTTLGNNLTLFSNGLPTSASVTGDGFLYQSTDGHTLELTGYYVPQGGSTTGAVRLVAVVKPDGTINYSTQLPSGDEGTIRGAISQDGNGFWVTGSGSLRYVPYGLAGGSPITVLTASESGNTVTLTTASAHGFVPGQVVTVSGLGVSGYNGTVSIATTPSTTTFTYAVSSSGLASSGPGSVVPASTRLSSYFGSLTSPSLFNDQLLVDGGAGAQFGGLVPALDGPGVVGNSAGTFPPTTPSQPTASGQAINPMGGFPTATDSGNASTFPTSNQFVFLDANTAIVADGRINGNGGIYVYYQNGANNWVSTSSVKYANASGANTGRGLLGLVVTTPTADDGTGTATVYATTIESSGNTNTIRKFDLTGIGGSNPTVAADASPIVATSAANQQFRGIAFAPTAASTNTVGSNSLTITPSSSATYGTQVTFQDTLTGDGTHGTPTGVVSFRYGNIDIGTATLNPSGVATFKEKTNLPVGVYDGGSGAGHFPQITAVYTGDSHYAANTSTAQSYTINQDGTTTSLTINPNPVGVGVNYTLTATIAPADSGVPTGTVTFVDGSTTLGNGVLTASVVSNGSGGATTIYTASFTGSFASTAGSPHSITATYNGDVNFSTSTSSAGSLTVMNITTPTVTSDTGTGTVGNSIVFTAIVPGGSPGGSQAGTVNFYDNQLLLSASVTYSTVNTNDLKAVITLSATLTQSTNTLTPGIHTMTAQFVPSNPANFYVANGFMNQTITPHSFGVNDILVERVGDGTTAINTTSGNSIYVDEYTNSTSTSTLVQSIAFPIHDDAAGGTNHALVQQAQQSTTGGLTLSGNGQYIFLNGYDVNLDPTVAPSGSVDVRSGSTFARTIGRIKYDGTVDSGVAISDAGSGNFNDVYSLDGASFYVTGQGNTVRYKSTYTQQAATQTTTSIASTSISGTSNTGVGLEIFGGQLYVIGGSPTGTLKVGTVGTGIPTTSGQTVTELPGITTNTSTNTYPYFCVDAYFTHLDGSSAPAGINTVYIADDGLTFGTGSISKWALVSGSWTKVGEVDYSGTNLGFYWMQGQTATNGSGATTGVTLFSTYGNGGGGNTGPGLLYALTDTNGYNAAISSSSATLIASDDNTTNNTFRGVALVPENLTDNLTANPTGSQTVGNNVTFTFATNNGATGTVYFFDGTTALGTPQVLSSGSASVSTTSLALGVHTIYAYYTGDATHVPLSKTLSYTIVTATNTGLTSSVNPSVWGQSVTFTATVTNNPSGGAVATGTVTFKDGSTTLGTGTLNGSGVATFATTALTVSGSPHSITAVYAGDTSHQTSTSSAVNQTVNADATTTTVYWTGDNGATFNQNTHSSTFGNAVTFSAWVYAPVPGVEVPTGNVQFQVNGSNLGSAVALNGAGVATITFSTANSNALPLGTDVVTAIFQGSTNYAGSSSSGGPTQIVSKDIAINTRALNGSTAPILKAQEGSGNVVTITTDGPHGFHNGDHVVITLDADAGTSGYDGTYVIGNVTATTFTYTASLGSLPTENGLGLATDAVQNAGVLTEFGAQASMVDSVVYVFNQPVSLNAGAFTIAVDTHGTNSIGNGGPAPTLTWNSPDGGTTWVITFSGSGVYKDTIADGGYDLTLDHTKIHAVLGTGTLASNDAQKFEAMYGDDFDDLIVGTDSEGDFNATFGLHYTDASFLPEFDADRVGQVTTSDSGYFNGNFGAKFTGFTPTIF